MNYQKVYDSLVNKRRLNTLSEIDEGEIHHIIPKSINKSLEFTQSNLIKLTYREHFIAHKLLYHIYKNTNFEEKMAYALWRMSYINKDSKYEIVKSSKQFSQLKHSLTISLSIFMSMRIWVNDGNKNKRVFPNQIPEGFVIGRLYKTSEETKKKLKMKSKNRIFITNGIQNKHIPIDVKIPEGWYEGSKSLSISHREKLRQANLKRVYKPLSLKTKKQISESLKGNTNRKGKKKGYKSQLQLSKRNKWNKS